MPECQLHARPVNADEKSSLGMERGVRLHDDQLGALGRLVQVVAQRVGLLVGDLLGHVGEELLALWRSEVMMLVCDVGAAILDAAAA